MMTLMLQCLALLLPFFIASYGRLTEVLTDRYPVLYQNLHSLNIDLGTLSARAMLGPRSEFKYRTGELVPNGKGSQRVRLIQTYAGYEVFGPVAVAEVDMKGHFTGHLYGDVARNLHKDIPNPESCVRDVNVLLNISIRLEKLRPDDPNIDQKDGRRAIYADPEVGRARIIYVVEFFYEGDNFVSIPVYYFDACRNRVMFSFNKVRNMSIPLKYKPGDVKESNVNNKTRINTLLSAINTSTESHRVEEDEDRVRVGCSPSASGVGGNRKTRRRNYGTPPLCLPVKRIGMTCTMEGKYVTVVDNQFSLSTKKTGSARFMCGLGYRDAINGAYGIANDALYFGEMSGKFIETFSGQKALKWTPRMVVHYGKGYENAFWTGKDMFFGDGKRVFYPLVSIDIVAHELAHGITSTNSNLIYRGQPGGINEAFSDITGAATYKFVNGKVNWKLGSDVMKSNRRALRYMNNPPRDGRSIKTILRYRPGMDVHYSSGVFNFAFYLMVRSIRMTTNEAFGNFLNANKLLWGTFTRFRKGACNVVQASYDSGTNFKIVRRAFRRTLIPLLLCNHRALKTTLFPGETREDILVNHDRSPIFEVNLKFWNGTGVTARKNISDDSSQNKNDSVLKIVVARDGDAEHIIAQGNNYVAFPGNHSVVYVKLMTDQKSDMKVTITISE